MKVKVEGSFLRYSYVQVHSKACPFNPNPETPDGAKISEEFSECFTPAIRNVVDFAKCIPGFLVLSQEDQVTLLKVREE